MPKIGDKKLKKSARPRAKLDYFVRKEPLFEVPDELGYFDRSYITTQLISWLRCFLRQNILFAFEQLRMNKQLFTRNSRVGISAEIVKSTSRLVFPQDQYNENIKLAKKLRRLLHRQKQNHGSVDVRRDSDTSSTCSLSSDSE